MVLLPLLASASFLSAVPAWVVALVVSALVTAVAPLAVQGYQALVAFAKAKLGLTLPDNPTVDADIEKAVKLLLPGLIKLLESGALTLPALVALAEQIVKSVDPSADTAAVAKVVVANLPTGAAAASSISVPGLDRDPAKS